MKQYTLSFCDSLTHIPEYPTRTGYKTIGFCDVTYQVWSNQKARDKTIELQRAGINWKQAWSPWETSRYAEKLLKINNNESEE
jgi:hypothetical protein